MICRVSPGADCPKEWALTHLDVGVFRGIGNYDLYVYERLDIDRYRASPFC